MWEQFVISWVIQFWPECDPALGRQSEGEMGEELDVVEWGHVDFKIYDDDSSLHEEKTTYSKLYLHILNKASQIIF